MDKVVRIFHSFEKADKADREYFRSLTPPQRRLDILLTLIADQRELPDQASEGFARVYRITQLSRR